MLATTAASVVAACEEASTTDPTTPSVQTPARALTPQAIEAPALERLPELAIDPFAGLSVVEAPEALLVDGCTVRVSEDGATVSCTAPSGAEQWSQPVGPEQDVVHGSQVVAWNSDVAVLDRSAGVVVIFDERGTLAGRWPEGERLAAPWDATPHGGELLVTDPSSHRVLAIDATGATRVFAEAPGDGTGVFNGPAGIARREGEVLVTDLGNARVCRFADDGRFLGSFGSYEQGLRSPRSVAIDALGRVFVADPVAGRIWRFEQDTLVGHWTPDGGAPFAPTRVQLAADGSLTVVTAFV